MKKKYIQINTYQEYKKFLKIIKIYKSLFYQHILFVTDSKIPNVEKICTALNIKKDLKEYNIYMMRLVLFWIFL